MKMHFFDKNEQNKDNIIADNNKLLADNKDLRDQVTKGNNDMEAKNSQVKKMTTWLKILVISNVVMLAISVTSYIYKAEIQSFIKIHISGGK